MWPMMRREESSLSLGRASGLRSPRSSIGRHVQRVGCPIYIELLSSFKTAIRSRTLSQAQCIPFLNCQQSSTMEIETIYVYPIKSMRGVSLPRAKLTQNGFPHDRTFMILQPTTDENNNPTLKNITIAPNNELVRFWTDMDTSTSTLKVTWKPVGGGDEKSIEIPLEPDTSGLEEIDVVMHKSPTQAYKMDDKYNTWLSSCLGYDVILAYIGEHKRQVRMSSLGYNALESNTPSSNNSGWLSSITSAASQAASILAGNNAPKPSEIGFADVAPYLITSSKSMESVLSRLPTSEQSSYSIQKFRPNIVVRGAAAVWEEDFWGQLTIHNKSSGNPVEIECEHNCARCRSINIDYETGEQGTGEAGSMLKKLSKDRRVDAGAKWTPVFGRYSFLKAEFEGAEIGVGDEVVVSKVNEERTGFGELDFELLPFLIGVLC